MFNDLSFDSLPHGLILTKLAAYGISSKSCVFIGNYLTDRLQREKLGNQFSDWSPLLRGIPQGSVLGPLLFNIYLDDLLLSSLQSKISSFADDNQIFDINNDVSLLHGQLQTDLLTAHSWFCSNGLVMNPDQYATMWLGKSNDTTIPCFSIGRQEISFVGGVKLLGVTLIMT